VFFRDFGFVHTQPATGRSNRRHAAHSAGGAQQNNDNGRLECRPALKGFVMRFMTFEDGYKDGKLAVETADEAEINMTMTDHEADLLYDLKQYKQGATAAEIGTYSAGYMRGVEDALVAGAVDASECAHPDCPVDRCVF
jgi:hypothetical protein